MTANPIYTGKPWRKLTALAMAEVEGLPCPICGHGFDWTLDRRHRLAATATTSTRSP